MRSPPAALVGETAVMLGFAEALTVNPTAALESETTTLNGAVGADGKATRVQVRVFWLAEMSKLEHMLAPEASFTWAAAVKPLPLTVRIPLPSVPTVEGLNEVTVTSNFLL